jgi:hypothetical protein
MPIVELIPLVMGAVGGLLAWWGRAKAKAPIDPTLIARVGTHDIRLPIPVRSDPFPPRSESFAVVSPGQNPLPTCNATRDPRGLFGE